MAALEHNPVAAELPAFTKRHSLDTPAKHTRSRSRQQGPLLVAQGVSDPPGDADGAGKSGRNSHRNAKVGPPALDPDSNAASSADGQSEDDGEASSADSESEEAAPDPAAAGKDTPPGGEQSSDEEEGEENGATSSAESDSEGSGAIGKGVRSAARPGLAAEPYEDEESSSGWSSEDQEEGDEGHMSELALSMLAALESVDGGRILGGDARPKAQRTHVSSGAQNGCT